MKYFTIYYSTTQLKLLCAASLVDYWPVLHLYSTNHMRSPINLVETNSINCTCVSNWHHYLQTIYNLHTFIYAPNNCAINSGSWSPAGSKNQIFLFSLFSCEPSLYKQSFVYKPKQTRKKNFMLSFLTLSWIHFISLWPKIYILNLFHPMRISKSLKFNFSQSFFCWVMFYDTCVFLFVFPVFPWYIRVGRRFQLYNFWLITPRHQSRSE